MVMVSTQVCQSEGSGFKSRSGQIAYFHGVKTRLSTLETMFLVVWTPRKTVGPVSDNNLGDIKDRPERLESPLPVYFGN